jgi:L-threonylcarbamoyladenylate synthase
MTTRRGLEILPVDLERPSGAVLKRAERALAGDELIIYPTDTLYAIGGRGMVASVARHVREAKGRLEAKPLPLVAADVSQAAGLSSRWSELAACLAAAFWPGPLSLVVEAGTHVPREVTANTGSLAVRVPAARLVRLLCASQGPLVSTSANLAAAPAPRTCVEAVAALGHVVAVALDGGLGGPVGSTLVDVRGRQPRLVRSGVVPWPQVVEAWRRSACC